MQNKDLFKLQVLELTKLLTDEECFKDLKSILTQKGFSLEEIILVSFGEDEDETEYGVIISKQKTVTEYERSTAKGKNNINYVRMKDITDAKDYWSIYGEQIEVGLEMINNGEILNS